MQDYFPGSPWLGPYPQDVVDNDGLVWHATGPNTLKPYCSCKPCPAVYVSIIAGQSNAVGNGFIYGLDASNRALIEPFWPVCYAERNLIAQGNAPQVPATTFYDVPFWTAVTPKQGASGTLAGRMGVELSLSRKIHMARPDRCEAKNVLLKYAVGGSKIEQWRQGHVSGIGDAWLSWLSTQLRLVREQFCGSVMCRAIYWIQGESDLNLQGANNYVDNLNGFVDEYRSVCDVPLVFSRLHAGRNPVTDDFADAINSAVSDAGYANTVSNDDLDLLNDNVHYKPNALVELGCRLSDVLV